MIESSMRSITTRFDSPGLRLVLRILYYTAILAALWAVAEGAGTGVRGFVYQDF